MLQANGDTSMRALISLSVAFSITVNDEFDYDALYEMYLQNKVGFLKDVLKAQEKSIYIEADTFTLERTRWSEQE